jgi:hypothetical protein
MLEIQSFAIKAQLSNELQGPLFFISSAELFEALQTALSEDEFLNDRVSYKDIAKVFPGYVIVLCHPGIIGRLPLPKTPANELWIVHKEKKIKGIGDLVKILPTQGREKKRKMPAK